ncbi:ATP-binding cassette domain-containing protein [Lentilactobacillus parafarraginis]|jgi:ATP-binding cassette subfamily B protein|uniref:ATP-binding cassette domain-containing protein n=1 Tax=Lentilactobacillus parafarraginis TaxID=390842 RepID=A0A5R9CX40_9LACO|nr:ABC transporter transmembrane domain-containing protein [Lentilactobacillus parafarraginis]TLQ20206.1 ATP-binding cassette domain-containing protein [Lentilactobacillus parafarraginis]
MSIFAKLSWYFKEEWKTYLVGVGGLILTALLAIIPPRIIGLLVDAIHSGKLAASTLIMLLILLTVVAIAQYGSRYMWRTAIWGEAAKLEKVLRNRLFWHYTQMDQEFFQKYRTGDLMAHATNDLSAIQRVAGGGILQFADSMITGGTTLIAMVSLIDWRLTIIAIIPFPLLAVMARYMGSKIHVAFRDSQAAFSRLNNKAEESITGIKVIKGLGQQEEDMADFDDQVAQTININRRVNRLDSLFDPMTTMIISLSYVITIVYGGYLVTTGQITIGALVSFVSYLAMMIWPMFAVGMLFNTLERGNASYDRVMDLLNQTSKVIDDPNGATTAPRGEIDYDVEKFSYPGDNRLALENINFKIPAGKTVGLVGRVGSGKSTILRLMLRQFDNYTGTIKFGGIDIRHYKMDALIPAIGYVPQDTFLFSDSIRENIRFARPEASQEAVETAAKKSDLYNQIKGMPDGYDTAVGEEGISLSGGQRQRLAIARALLINPELLILDDALSAVDAETETQILRNLRAERKEKTTIISAHRLSSVMDADEILVINDGQIVERGTHDQLMANNGWYKEMFERQELETKVKGGAQNG